MERRIERINEEDERIDTVTPSVRPTPAPDDRRDRIYAQNRQAPRLKFTTKDPSPDLTRPRSVKRKLSSVLDSDPATEEREVLEDAAGWEAEGRPDPLITDFFDEVDPPVDRPGRLSTTSVTPRADSGRTAKRSSGSATAGRLAFSKTPTTEEDPGEIGAFLQEKLGSDELRRIEGQKSAQAASNATAAPAKTSDPRDKEIGEFPSASTSTRRPHPAPPPPTRQSVNPTSTTTTTSGSSDPTSKMLSGTGMTAHLLEAIIKTKDMFAAKPASPAPPTGGIIAPKAGRGRPRTRVPKGSQAGPGHASTAAGGKKSKGKARDPRERPNELRRADTEVTLPPTYRPRATQLPSRTDIRPEDDVEVRDRPASPMVVVDPARAPASFSVKAMKGPTPRIGLQRSVTQNQASGKRPSMSRPMTGGKSMSALNSRESG